MLTRSECRSSIPGKTWCFLVLVGVFLNTKAYAEARNEVR